MQKIKDSISLVEKSFGKGAIMKLGENLGMQVQSFSSGSISLDIALGIGGYPRGRIIEIYGPESSGKTTLALHAIAQIQKLGDTAAMIDAEHAFDPTYAKNLGIDVDNLYVSQPSNGEEALEILDMMLTSGISLFVVDSVAALTPKAELEGEMGESKMGLHARLMSQALRKIVAKVNQNNVTIIFINQLREKIGVMFGSPEVTTGGNALKFYASVRLDVRKAGQNKDGDEVISNKTKVKVIKNKVAPPFKTAEVEIMYGEGISKVGEIIDLASNLGIIDKSGAWFSYKGEKIGQGAASVREFLKKNPEIDAEITAQIKEKLFGTETATSEE